eukprot:6386864-Pyramimonas_sp.AAC.1
MGEARRTWGIMSAEAYITLTVVYRMFATPGIGLRAGRGAGPQDAEEGARGLEVLATENFSRRR